MTINGTSYQVDIIGKNHDTYTAGGTAPLTFQLHNCYATSYQMNSTDTNTGGWTNCDMRVTHLPAILAKMPSEVQAGIKAVNKLTSAGRQSSAIRTTADKLFLLSEIEIFGSTSYSKSGEGTWYPYYYTTNNRDKDTVWWERSPRGDSSTIFCYVDGNPYAGCARASSTLSVVFAFCF